MQGTKEEKKWFIKIIGKKYFPNWQGNEMFIVEYKGSIETEGLALMSKKEVKLAGSLIYGRFLLVISTFILWSNDYNYLQPEWLRYNTKIWYFSVSVIHLSVLIFRISDADRINKIPLNVIVRFLFGRIYLFRIVKHR